MRIPSAVNISPTPGSCGGEQSRRRESTMHVGSLSTIIGSGYNERLGATRQGLGACRLAPLSPSVLWLHTFILLP